MFKVKNKSKAIKKGTIPDSLSDIIAYKVSLLNTLYSLSFLQ
jgi:hypothetical protein